MRGVQPDGSNPSYFSPHEKGICFFVHLELINCLSALSSMNLTISFQPYEAARPRVLASKILFVSYKRKPRDSNLQPCFSKNLKICKFPQVAALQIGRTDCYNRQILLSILIRLSTGNLTGLTKSNPSFAKSLIASIRPISIAF